MPRRRLGVVLPLPEPAATAVDGLRRALGVVDLDRIRPHVTLVPPVNVREADVPAAVAAVEAAAASAGPVVATLGPPATFAPVTPVLYLSVGGDDARVAAGGLRRRAFVPPLTRPITHDFVPHVTLVEDLPSADLAAAVHLLAAFRTEVTLDAVHLLEERRDDDGRRAWTTYHEAPLGGPEVVARGGLPLELSVTHLVPADAPDLPADPLPRPAGEPLVVTARRDGVAVGLAAGWTRGPLGVLDDLGVSEADRRQGIGRHLLRAWERAAAGRGAAELVAWVGVGAAEAMHAAAGWHHDTVAGSARAQGAGGSLLRIRMRRTAPRVHATLG